MNKFQRGAVASFAIAFIGGVAFSLATVVSEAKSTPSVATYTAEESKELLLEEGYKVIYNRNSGEALGEHHFSSCNNASDFMLIDNNWRPSGSKNFQKVICR
jgi:hypothetical protein